MSQITSGIRGILSYPWVYDSLQSLMGASQSRKRFVQQSIRPSDGEKILDIGCGTAELLAFLPTTVKYVGYDPSDAYIAHAKARYEDAGTFHVGLFDSVAAQHHGPFDIVIASGVLHHMDDDQVVELMGLAYESLVPGGRLVTIDPVLCSPQNPVARFLINNDRGQNVRGEKEYTQLATQSFSHVTGFIRHQTWIPYTHWIMECRK